MELFFQKGDMISNYVIICKSFSIDLFCLCGCRTTLQLATSALQQKQHPTYPALDLYLHIHRGRDYERESVHVQWAASHSDTPTHTPIVNPQELLAQKHMHESQTDWMWGGQICSLLSFAFYSLSSALILLFWGECRINCVHWWSIVYLHTPSALF